MLFYGDLVDPFLRPLLLDGSVRAVGRINSFLNIKFPCVFPWEDCFILFCHIVLFSPWFDGVGVY